MQTKVIVTDNRWVLNKSTMQSLGYMRDKEKSLICAYCNVPSHYSNKCEKCKKDEEINE
jgi:primosomal protein N'